MKKMLLFFVEIFVIVLIPIYCFCYTNEYFTINNIEKYTFEEENDNSSKMYGLVDNEQNGNNIYIVVTPYKDNKHYDIYSEYAIEDLINEVKKKAKDGNYNISIMDKEVSTVGSKFYKCIIIKYKNEDLGIYQKQFIISSKHYIYTITITADKEEYFFNKDVTNAVNSFTINDELIEEKSNTTFMNNVINVAIKVIALMIISSIIIILTKDNKKEEKEKQTEDDSESQALELLIEKMQKEKDKKV